nr:hypothetical protein [Tanacetum cinerariifolium]
MSSSIVTYTLISSDYKEPSDAGSPGVIVYGYDELPMHPVDPYMEAALQAHEQAPSSLDYVPGPEHLPSPDYVPGLEEPEQASISPNYEDPEEDPKEDHADYPADGGDDADDESSDDDDDYEEEEQEASKDDDDEEKEHPAPVDSSVVLVDDPVPLAEDTKAFETDESAPTHVPSPRPTISPTYAEAPLGYRASMIQLRAASPSTHHPPEIPSPPLLLPSTTHRDHLPEADMPLCKKAHFTAPIGRFEVGESSSAAAARQDGHTLAHTVDYGFIDTMDASICVSESRAMNAVGVVNERVIDLELLMHWKKLKQTEPVEMAMTAMIQELAEEDRCLLFVSAPRLTSSNVNPYISRNEEILEDEVEEDNRGCTNGSSGLGKQASIFVISSFSLAPSKVAPSDEFPLPEDFPTASEERLPLMRIQQYLQNEHYALLEVIDFGDSYEAPQDDAAIGSASEGSAKKKGRTVAVTAEDIQKRRNDVKARTTLLLALPDEHQLKFSNYKTAQELWAAILKTFGENEATKKTKKNQLKQQYGNFKAEGSEILEQTFNRLQVIIRHLEFMDVEIEQDDLNQKFLTSLALEWLVYMIVWRNRGDLDTMSLGDVYNHLKVFEPEVQKKSESNSQNMAFISSAKNSSRNGEVNTPSIPTASTQVSPANANIDKDDIIKWNMSLLSMRANRLWKKTRKKISIQGTDVAGFDKSKVECFNCHKMGHFARKCRAPKSQDRGRRENFRQGSKEEEQAPKALMAIDGVEARLVEFKNQEIKFRKKIRGLEFKVESKTNKIKSLTNELEMVKKEKEGLDSKLTVYSPPQKDMSWTGLPEFADNTITDYSRPSPNIETDSPTIIKTNKDESVRKLSIKYPEMYRKTSKSSNVRGNQRNWNNLKSQQLGKKLLMKNKACFNCGDFDHLSYDCGNSQSVIDDKGYWDSGCSRHMTGNISYLSDYEPYDGGTSRQYNMYSIDLNNVVPHKDLSCLVAKASADKSMLWHRRLGHLNFKTMNRLVRHNLVKGLPSKCFDNDHTYVARLKGKQHKASCKTKLVNSVTKPLHTLHMDLFGPTSVSSLNHKWYCLVVTDDFSRFTWTFFLKTKDETSGILRNFITEIENLKELKVKIIRVLVNKSQNKTPYELFNGRTPAIGFLKPFGCHVMILNTLDHLGKFEAKGDEDFLENKLNKKGAGPNWLFDIDTLTNSMNYVPVVSAGTTFTNFSAHLESSTSNAQDACKADAPESSGNSNPTTTLTNPLADQTKTLTVETPIPTISSPVPTACLNDSSQPSSDTRLISKRVTSQDDTPSLENILTLSNRFEDILGVTTNSDETNGVEADLSNMENNISASPTPTFRIHKDHPTSQIYGPVDTPVQTKTKSKEMEEQSFIESIHHMTNPDLLKICLFSCFLSQEEPKKIFDALKDPRVRPIGTKWVLKNKKVERGIVIRNKARLVAQGHTHEEGIDYEEIFAPVARIESIRLFLAYASFMGFTVYQIDVKRAFLYGTIDEEVYVMQPFGFQDSEFPARVYKGIDETGKDVDLHLYRSMIGSLMYLTASRPDIMFAVCACARHQVTPKECHLHAVKRIFRSLKSHLKLGIWYPKDSPFDLVAYSDSDYGGATQDRKSTTEGCQFLGRRLISWQYKKQTIVDTSTTEAKYVAAASDCGQVLWI